MMAKYSQFRSCFVFGAFIVIFLTHLGFFCKSEDVSSSPAESSESELEAEVERKALTDEVELEQDQGRYKLPTVFIPILARNKAHALPTFLAYIERLNYPKDRISIWIRTDHNEDGTAYLLYQWALKVQNIYHSVDFNFTMDPNNFTGQEGPYDWTDERYDHLIDLREMALLQARYNWADYLFPVDTDNFLTNPNVLRILIKQNKTLVAPMLNSLTMYSNFWGAVSEKGYYKRSPEYVLMLRRNITGLYQVPMIHSTYLVNLRHKVSDKLSYEPSRAFLDRKSDIDDMLTFKDSADSAGIPMYIMNTHIFGKLLPPAGRKDSLYDEGERVVFLRLEAMLEADDEPMPTSEYLTDQFPAPDKMGFDEIYMINLVRRPLRRKRMVATMRELGIQAQVYDAVDGKALSTADIIRLGIDMLPGYLDPWAKRTLTKGEIGCFLSHYYIWQEVVEKGYEKILIIEDDIRFEYKFRAKMHYLFKEIEEQQRKWDLIYVGRKILRAKDEAYLNGSKILVSPSYSYWTLSYMLTLEGAKKLLAQEPLGKMIPVDEYLPIMFNKHPRNDWAEQFHPRDLVTYSVNPLFVFPTHYTGEPNYISDTETSGIWEEELKGQDPGCSKSSDDQLETGDSSGGDKSTSNGTNAIPSAEEPKKIESPTSTASKEDPTVSKSIKNTEL